MTTTHCDDYIDDPSQPECLRAFLGHVRSPAHGSLRPEPRPTLFADYQSKRVRVVMASRFGDVGITSNLAAERGYEQRVDISELSNFAETPSGHARDCEWHCEQYPWECTCGLAASVDTLPKGQDAKQGLAGTESGAVPSGTSADAQTPSDGL